MTYDPKSEPQEFIGGSRDEAVAKACSFFGATEEELSLVELDPAEVSGLGAQVVVVARLVREGGQRRPASRPDSPPRQEPRGESSDRPRERSRREPRRGPREERGSREERGPRDEYRAEPREQLQDEPLPDAPSEGTATTPIGTLGEFVCGVVERMNVGPFDIAESEEGELILIQVTGSAAKQLRSGEGRAVDAIQLLANQAAIRAGQKDRRVVVDVEGEPGQREGFLERMAERAASRAQDSERPVALEPMNPKDRRVIHVALRDTEGVTTMSIGQGRYRQVVVVPEGAPEYEEAQRYEVEATRDEE